MQITLIDVLLFAGFFIFVVSFSLWRSRGVIGHSENTSDFFLAGRRLTWPLIGISIVAANISSEQMVGMSGEGAGEVGLAVSAWQLLGAVFIVVIAVTLLPRFLRAGIYTMPEFLEFRYNATARTIMALLTVIIYVGVLLTAVLYTGATALDVIFGIPFNQAVWIVGAIGTVYAASGGLRAIAYADLIQGLALLVGGMIIFFVSLNAVGGWTEFTTRHADSLHMVLPADDPNLPWHAVVFGLWIVMIYYCGLNQFIVQRNLAARTLKDGQLGMVFAGALWLLVPFAIVMPGIMAGGLFLQEIAEQSDRAYPTLIRELIGPGLRGFILAAMAGAIVSTLASMLNSASTIATIDVYQRLLSREASQKHLVRLGRILTVAFVVIACLIAPLLTDRVFQFIQQFQGFIWPGVVAAFLGAFMLPRAPAAAGVAALVLGPVFYSAFQLLTKQGLFSRILSEPLFEMHFLIQVLWCFVLIFAVMAAITAIRPLSVPRVLPVRKEMDVRTEPVVKIAGGLVIAAVALFFIIFW